MIPLPDYKAIIELFKKGSTIEAQEKIMELQTERGSIDVDFGEKAD